MHEDVDILSPNCNLHGDKKNDRVDNFWLNLNVVHVKKLTMTNCFFFFFVLFCFVFF